MTNRYSKFEKSDTVSIKSKIFNSDRNIILTNSVKNKTDNSISKTIIYFDADDSDLNQMVIQSINNLIVNNESPNSNLVGIMQVDRNKEFLEKDDLTSFIIQELLPYLKQRKYNTEKIVVLGHSFGAYFSTYLFLTHNEIFNSCIAISPAYWPNNKDIFNYLQMLEDDKLDGNFHLSIGNKRWDDISISKYIDELEEKILKTQRKLRFRVNRLDGFSHNATPTVGIGLGISYIFDIWEWQNILEEQEQRLKGFPDFWGHLEIKADALYYTKRYGEALDVYNKSLSNLLRDKNETKKSLMNNKKRLKEKIKNLKKVIN